MQRPLSLPSLSLAALLSACSSGGDAPPLSSPPDQGPAGQAGAAQAGAAGLSGAGHAGAGGDSGGGPGGSAGGGAGGGSGGSAGGGSGGGPGGSAGASPAQTPLAITWAPCPLLTGDPASKAAECGSVDMPLDWSDPAGKTFPYRVKRLPARTPRRGSLWILDGGPGAGGIGPEGVANALDKLDGGLDIYIPHHRGTGESSKLTCNGNKETSASGVSITEAEWPKCLAQVQAKWGDDLALFTASNAARDLGALIASTALEAGQIFVFGQSYGTYLANRYLQLFPGQATAVILDSICPADRCYLDRFDVLYDEVGAEFLSRCAADEGCSARLGPDPRKRLGDLYTSLEGGHCQALQDLGVDRRVLRVVLGEMLNHWSSRLAIPATIVRVERCQQGDVNAVVHLVHSLFGSPGDPTPPFFKAWSFPLSNNIRYSELWTDPAPSVEAIEAEADATYLSKGSSLTNAALFPQWPRYPRDEYVGKWADASVPMLMLNGDLDPATPISIGARAKEHYTGPHQTFVQMPRAPHGAIFGSPVDTEGGTCGVPILLQFLADPTAPLDTSCTEKVLPLNFQGSVALSQKLFGTDEMYDEPAP